jgi:hypothetical protein
MDQMTIASNPEEPIFYVYVLADPRKPGDFSYGDLTLSLEPFYVGKGKGDRFRSHSLRSSPIVKNKINSIKKNTGRSHRAKILQDGLTEKQAYRLETKLIRLIGKKMTGEGPLLNLNDGGPGTQQGFVSDATKKRRSDSLKRYWAAIKNDKAACKKRLENMGRSAFTDKQRQEHADLKNALYASKAGKKLRRKLSKATIAIAAARSPQEVRRIYAKASATRKKNKAARAH